MRVSLDVEHVFFRLLVRLGETLAPMLACGAVLAILSPSYAQPCGGVRTLGTFGGTDGIAEAVSADGSVVVGRATDSAGQIRAFRWTAGSGMVDLGSFGGSVTRADAVTADGRVVYGLSINASNQGLAFSWTAAFGLQDLGLPGNTHPRGASGAGDVLVGVTPAFGQSRAFRWTATGGLQNLGTLFAASTAEAVSADGNVVVGWYYAPSARKNAFRWTAAGGMVNLSTLGGLEAEAFAASADGSVIVGRSLLAGGLSRAFRWTASAGMQNLGTLGGNDSGAYGVSSDGGVVVGWSNNLAGQRRAFRWTSAGGMEDLGLSQGRTWAEAYAVSADGSTIVGREGDAANNAAPFRWGPDVWIASAPRSQTTCASGGATFAVAVGGTGPFTYRWEWAHFTRRPEWTPVVSGTNTALDGTPLFEAGGVQSSLVAVGPPDGLSAFLPSLAAEPPELRIGFRCVVLNACGQAVSAYATLSICTADTNCDGFIDFFDYDTFTTAFETGDPRADYNADGFIDFFDYDDFVAAFEAGC